MSDFQSSGVKKQRFRPCGMSSCASIFADRGDEWVTRREQERERNTVVVSPERINKPKTPKSGPMVLHPSEYARLKAEHERNDVYRMSLTEARSRLVNLEIQTDIDARTQALKPERRPAPYEPVPGRSVEAQARRRRLSRRLEINNQARRTAVK
jgi:hypothetical protein